MAEVVEKFLEEIYEECSILYKAELFSLDEIRKFVKIRRALLYKAERKEKRPMDYMALINFDLKFYALLGIRRQKKGFYFNKSLEHRIIQRVSRLYKVLCFRFQDQVPFWLSYLSFCRRLGRYKTVDRELARMLQMHGDKADLWALAARWHFHERPNTRMALRQRARAKAKLRRERAAQRKAEKKEDEDDDEEEEEAAEDEEEGEREIRLATVEDGIKAARQALHAGLKMNPSCADLFRHYFAFELDVADWNRWRRNQGLVNPKLPQDTQDTLCSGELAGTVWETIRAKWPDSLPVVASCAELVERVGWPKAEAPAWVCDLFELRRSLTKRCEVPAPPSSLSVAAPEAPDLLDPAAQVAAFEAALAAEGSAGGRAVWRRAAQAGWASVPLLLRYAALESAQAEPLAAADLRKAFDLVACAAGQRSKDFWLAYVAFEEQQDPLRVPSVDWRARKSLPDNELNAFTVERLAPKLLAR